MKLIKITSRNRRDFHGIYKCENCGNEEKHSGYDDRNFQQIYQWFRAQTRFYRD